MSKRKKNPGLRETRKELDALKAANKTTALHYSIQSSMVACWNRGFIWGVGLGFVSALCVAAGFYAATQ